MKVCMTYFLYLVIGLGGVWVAAQAWQDWADENNTLPMRRFLSAEQIQELEAAGGSLQPLIVRSSGLDQKGYLLIVNPSRQAFYYTGYKLEAHKTRPPRGEISPLYKRQFQDEQGQWEKSPLAWCGTGAAKLAVPPGHAARFKVLAQDSDTTMRIGVAYQWNDGAPIQTVWSEASRETEK